MIVNNDGGKTLSRRDFLSAAALVMVGGLSLTTAPAVAIAEQPLPMAAGRRINPYSVAMSGSRNLSTFSDEYMLFELRRAIYDNSYWLWIRGTVYKGSNTEFGQGAKLVTPYGTVSDGMIYGSGNNWSVGSQRCTPAICIGVPTSTISVTYSGGTAAGYYTRTVKIPAESISRSPGSGA